VDEAAVIDPLAIDDVSVFWQFLAAGEHTTVVHAGREELRFSQHAIGAAPHQLVDTQIAAGLIGCDYPASLGNLVSRLIQQKLPKGETRTDWRRRPLSTRQLDYAVQDVLHLPALHDALVDRLQKLGRFEWLQQEMDRWQSGIASAEKRRRWRRVSGLNGLSARQMAIVRELWNWREDEAEARDQPARRILRDDLLVELARRQTADIKRISAVRGLNHRGLKPKLPHIASRIQTALDLPEEDCPKQRRREEPVQISVLGQFLFTALGMVCRAQTIAPSIVASVQDVRELVAYRLGFHDDDEDSLPALTTGWRAEVVGHLIDDLLAGNMAIRIADPLSNRPLEFEKAISAD